MAGLRFPSVQARSTEFLDLTSLTLGEFQLLVSPFETAFHACMATWRMDGKSRTARRFTVYQNYPLPTSEDRPLLCNMLKYVHSFSVGRSWEAEPKDPWAASKCRCNTHLRRKS